MVSTTPITARKTPTSKSSGVPTSTAAGSVPTVVHSAVMNGRPRQTAGRPLAERDEKPDAEQRRRVDQQRAAARSDAEAIDIQHERGGHDETADEPASRCVVAAQQQEQREQQEERHQEPRRRSEDERCHGCRSRPMRSSARTPIATVTSTVISPSVSKPRKSTRMTFTTLRPCASVGAASAKYDGQP